MFALNILTYTNSVYLKFGAERKIILSMLRSQPSICLNAVAGSVAHHCTATSSWYGIVRYCMVLYGIMLQPRSLFLVLTHDRFLSSLLCSGSLSLSNATISER